VPAGKGVDMTRPDLLLAAWFTILVVLAWHGRKQ
jgi:hypothetical protein